MASGLRDCVLIQRNCIVTRQLRQWLEGWSVSQYKILYCDSGLGVRGHWGAGRWGAQGARGARGRRILGRRAAGARGRRARAAGGRHGSAVGRQWAAGARAGTAWARRGARLGARSARGTAGLGVACALDGCAGWASWASFGALCTWLSSGSVFGPGWTRYFPESPNEHCSL